LDDAGIAHHAATRLDDGLGNPVAEMLAKGGKDRLAVLLRRRNIAQVACREAAAHVDHLEHDAFLGERLEYPAGIVQSPIPGGKVRLLRADMKGNAIRLDAKCL